MNGAEPTAAGADVAEEHDGGGALAPALADVGAVGFLADGVEFERREGALDAGVFSAAGGEDFEPVGLAFAGGDHEGVFSLKRGERKGDGGRYSLQCSATSVSVENI